MKTDNELIAEFMGLEKNHRAEYFIQDYPHIHASCFAELKYLRYHESWDWLMPVVEKISKNYDVSICYFDADCACYINKQSIEGFEICSYGNFEPSILNAYKAVVEFIKWYNKNNQ